MTRTDLYLTVHKGLRAALFAACTAVGRTDWRDHHAATATRDQLRHLFGLLTEHAEHEDEVILPELESLAAELHADLHAQHVRIEGLQTELARLLDRLAGASDAERESLGRRIHGRIGCLVAEHLLHMAREETDANRVLWAHRTDAELQALEGRIVGSIPPPRLVDWLEVMLPAMSLPERGEMLTGMAQAMPPSLFSDVTARARAAVGPQGWPAVAAHAS